MHNAAWWILAFFGVTAVINYATTKTKDKKKLIQNKNYAIGWLIVVLICFINGFRCLIHNADFNFYCQIALGIQFLVIALLPCGIQAINQNPPIKILRNMLFVILAVLYFSQAALYTH